MKTPPRTQDLWYHILTTKLKMTDTCNANDYRHSSFSTFYSFQKPRTLSSHEKVRIFSWIKKKKRAVIYLSTYGLWRSMRLAYLSLWRAISVHLLLSIETQLLQIEEYLPFLFHHLQYLLKNWHFTWDPQHSFMLEPKLLLSFSQQNPKCCVTQILCWDDKPLHLFPHAHRKKTLRDDITGNCRDRGTAAAIGEGQRPLEEFHAAGLRSIRKLSPFLEDLLKPNNLTDLVGLLLIHQLVKERLFLSSFFSLSLTLGNAPRSKAQK